MNLRPLALPAVALTSVILVTLGRFDPTMAYLGAFAGLAMATLIALAPGRPLLLFALLPLAAWIAQRPPWAGVLQAVIIAGTFIAAMGNLPPFVRGRDAWLPLGAGVGSAILVGFIAQATGVLQDTGGALTLVVILVAFRAAVVYVGGVHWLYAVAMGLSTAPYLGFAGLMIAGAETAFGLAALGSPVQYRLALVFGAPFVLVGLFL